MIETNFQKPKKVSIAIKLLLISIALGIITIVIDGRNDKIVIGTFVVTDLILLTLLYFMNNRSNWARIVFLILFILACIVFPLTISKTFKANQTIGVISVVSMSLQLFAMYQLFSKESNQWYK